METDTHCWSLAFTYISMLVQLHICVHTLHMIYTLSSSTLEIWIPKCSSLNVLECHHDGSGFKQQVIIKIQVYLQYVKSLSLSVCVYKTNARQKWISYWDSASLLWFIPSRMCKSRKKNETWKLLAQRTSICTGSVGWAHGTNSLSIIQEQGLQDGLRYMLVVYPSSFSSCFSVWHWLEQGIDTSIETEKRLNTVISALSLHPSLFSPLISNFTRVRGPTSLSFI